MFVLPILVIVALILMLIDAIRDYHFAWNRALENNKNAQDYRDKYNVESSRNLVLNLKCAALCGYIQTLEGEKRVLENALQNAK